MIVVVVVVVVVVAAAAAAVVVAYTNIYDLRAVLCRIRLKVRHWLKPPSSQSPRKLGYEGSSRLKLWI